MNVPSMSNVAMRSSSRMKLPDCGLVTSSTYVFSVVSASHWFHRVKYSFGVGGVTDFLSSSLLHDVSNGPCATTHIRAIIRNKCFLTISFSLLLFIA